MSLAAQVIRSTDGITVTWGAAGPGSVSVNYDNASGCSAAAATVLNVTIEDVTAPVPDVAVLPDVTGECSATVTVTPTASDDCAGTINATTVDPLSYTAQGTFTVTWTYDDGNGNTTLQTQTVIVDDVTPPVIPVLADVNVGECSGTPPTPATTDNCAGTINGTTPTVFPITAQGTTVVTWSFDDGNGNVVTADQNVIVDDVTAPVADVATCRM